MSSIHAAACVSSNAAQKEQGKFLNSHIQYQNSIGTLWEVAKQYIKVDRKAASPNGTVPVYSLSQVKLNASSDDMLVRLGHSTLLVRLDGQYILTDPVFSERASPVQWAGPKRFHPSPISIEDLPEIKAVVLSHDHYDHLDKAAIEKLKDKVEYFVTPLEVGEYLIKWGVDEKKVHQLNWWEEIKLDNLTLVATPSQHFSGRGVFDKDETLWASWVLKSERRNLFFSGDSGYFEGFKEIGERYGPFDITLVETGAYNALWSDIHMMPEESVQAHIDLKGKVMVPIHNGTFDLALHEWFDPFEQVLALSQEKNIDISVPVFGELVPFENPVVNKTWWRAVETNDIEFQSGNVSNGVR